MIYHDKLEKNEVTVLMKPLWQHSFLLVMVFMLATVSHAVTAPRFGRPCHGQ